MYLPSKSVVHSFIHGFGVVGFDLLARCTRLPASAPSRVGLLRLVLTDVRERGNMRKNRYMVHYYYYYVLYVHKCMRNMLHIRPTNPVLCMQGERLSRRCRGR